MKVTIVEVAKQAGVSVATVSRVINNNYPVNAKTKARVLKVIEDLNFVPNVQAQEVKKRKSKTIGVIVPSVDNMYFPEVVHGIEQQLMSRSYSLLITFSKNNKEQEQDCTRNLIGRNVAGIIIADASTSNVSSGFFKEYVKNTPIVFINGDPSQSEFSFVMSDEEKGTIDALNHLWENGHEHVYFVRGENSYSYDIKEKTYQEFYAKKGVNVERNVICVGEGNSSDVIGYTTQKFVNLLKMNHCSAAFCCNDLMALGVVNACKENALRVPKDFSIIGFDNVILSKYAEPKLTTVDQHMHQLGVNAAQLILENITTEIDLSKKVVLNTSLVKRETVGKFRNPYKRKKEI